MDIPEMGCIGYVEGIEGVPTNLMFKASEAFTVGFVHGMLNMAEDINVINVDDSSNTIQFELTYLNRGIIMEVEIREFSREDLGSQHSSSEEESATRVGADLATDSEQNRISSHKLGL